MSERPIKHVLFVCYHNAGRSQMAEAYFNLMARERDLPFRAQSAGALPKYREVNPVVVEAMSEAGISLQGQTPKMLRAVDIEWADRVITMHCGVDPTHCPEGLPEDTVDWNLEDPAGKPIEVVRRVRDEVKAKVEALLTELGASEKEAATV